MISSRLSVLGCLLIAIAANAQDRYTPVTPMPIGNIAMAESGVNRVAMVEIASSQPIRSNLPANSRDGGSPARKSANFRLDEPALIVRTKLSFMDVLGVRVARR